MTKPPRIEWVITLRADPRDDEGAAHRALRAFLKCALRSWGLRCIHAERLEPKDKEA
jgi:hypothetical protein